MDGCVRSQSLDHGSMDYYVGSQSLDHESLELQSLGQRTAGAGQQLSTDCNAHSGDKHGGQPRCTSVIGISLHLHWRSVDVVWISGTAVHWNSGQWTHWTLTDHCRATTVFCRCTAGQSRTTCFIKSRHWDKSCLPLDCGATYTFVDGSIGWRPTQNHGQDKHDGHGCEQGFF